MSRVPEHRRYVDDLEVSDILTSPTSGMVRILLLTELVLLTSVLSVTLDFKTQHYTECSDTVASKISSILGHVKQGMLWRLHTHCW